MANKPSTARGHVDKARDILEIIAANAGKLSFDQMLQAAQIHALLAVAEAQRTANMLTFAGGVAISDDVIRRVND